jgi:crotonobetainyl-CoA:carnitine CoA-transferase CaiB-like acyl-CoA transferase
MALPLEGIKVIDFTGVQAGPACTQLLAWFGADVLKVERPGVGDVTRRQLRDVPDLDALYFITLNSNKKSLTLNTKTPEGKAIMEKLIRQADVLVENFAPGAMDRMGFTWERIQQLNPRLVFGSIKGFSEGSPYADLKVYDNVAQCAGGAASTTGFWDRSADGQRCGAGRQQYRHASGDRPPDRADRPREDRQGSESGRVDAGCGAESVPRQAAGSGAAGSRRLSGRVPAVSERKVWRCGPARR